MPSPQSPQAGKRTQKPTAESKLFTPAAKEAVTKARQTLGLLSGDLQSLNKALTTGGEDGSTNPAESLAHDALLEIMRELAPIQHRLSRLAAGITQ